MSIEINMRVESYDVQPNGNLKISSLLKMLQKAAGDDVNRTKLNYFSLAEKNIAFVLTKMTLKVLQEIKLYDELLIISHPRKTRGASFPRDFIIKRNNAVVAVARSMWVLLDLEKRTILRPGVVDEIGSLDICDDDIFDISDVRRIIDDSPLSRTNVHTVEYSFLDMNNHLNNTFYADFIFNSLSKIDSLHESDEGLYLQINYKNEARLGDVIEIHTCSSDDGNQFDFSAKNITGDKICFTAYVSYGVN
ncbi:MAG: hypothetical protein J6E38_01775 [Clostridia bacterium]|nr:hypothetical protein [Clostridia bacterium]